jgi:hypothetical protein
VPQFSMTPIYDPNKVARVDLAINLRLVSDDGTRHTEEVPANQPFYVVGYLVGRVASAPVTVVLATDDQHRVVFVDAPGDTSSQIRWKTGQPNEGVLRRRLVVVVPK